MKHRIRQLISGLPMPLRKAIVLVIGGLVLVIGILMIVLPGPAVVFIPLGLAILSLEFAWAHAWLSKAQSLFRKAVSKARRRRSTRKAPAP